VCGCPTGLTVPDRFTDAPAESDTITHLGDQGCGGRRAGRGGVVLSEHLPEISKLRHVEIQVMPTDREDHAGMGGPLQLLRLRDGKTLGHSEGQLYNRVISDPREVQILEMRYGMIRAQALPPRESLTFIEKVLGEET
jgi:hypothetical protein